MMLDKVLITAQSISGSFHNDDDFVDRCNHRYTTFILLTFVVVVSTKTYVGDPINCWCPAQFTTSHIQYTNSICWVKNTYYVADKYKYFTPADRKMIVYYQWVPMILLFMAMLFYAPRLVWKVMNARSGVEVNDMVEAASTLTITKKQVDIKSTRAILVIMINRYLLMQKQRSQDGCIGNMRWRARTLFCCCGSRKGNFLVAMFIITKLFYLVNSIGQLFLLNVFLGRPFHVYGYNFVKSLLTNKDFQVSNMFPKVTLCDFYMRVMNNIQHHTVQCVLPINLFNEKIFIFLWFWFLIISVMNILRLLSWLKSVVLWKEQISYVKSQLKIMKRVRELTKKENRIDPEDKEVINCFVKKYLMQDGVLLLRLIAINVNQIVVSQLTAALFIHWKNYVKNGNDQSIDNYDDDDDCADNGRGVDGDDNKNVNRRNPLLKSGKRNHHGV